MGRNTLKQATLNHFTGAAHEHLAAYYYLRQGIAVYWPTVQQGYVDFVIDRGGLKRVQVKTAHWSKDSRYRYLQCRTRLEKAATMSDLYDLFVAISPENRLWEIPARLIDSTNLCLDSTGPRSSKRWCRFERVLDLSRRN